MPKSTRDCYGIILLLDGLISHDKISRFLNSNEFGSKDLWQYVKPEVHRLEKEKGGVLILDDSIEEKPYTDENEIISWHFSHAKGRCIKGVNLLSCLVRYEDIALSIAFAAVCKDIHCCNLKTKTEKRESSITKNQMFRTMKQISGLLEILSQFFDWHKCRLDCLGQIIQALFIVRIINLTQVASPFKSEVKEESSYRRVCRFFADFSFDMSGIVLLIFRLFPLGDKRVLILDRTNWKWGKTPINILMLSIAYRDIGIPLFWVVLNLEGNSWAEDRIDLLKQVVKRLGINRIEPLLADREFIGTQWFGFLIEQKIPFIIRAKQNFMVEIKGNEKLPIGCLRKWFSRKKIVNHPINLWDLSLYVLIEKKRDAKEPMIVVSNFKFEDPLRLYRRRWEIETMFGCLKGRGFRMEDTHITDPDKIEKVVFLLAIAFCWAYRTGDIQDQIQAIEVKTDGRKARSLFREGLNLIRRAILGRWIFRKFRRLLECFTYSKTKGCGLRIYFLSSTETKNSRMFLFKDVTTFDF